MDKEEFETALSERESWGLIFEIIDQMRERPQHCKIRLENDPVLSRFAEKVRRERGLLTLREQWIDKRVETSESESVCNVDFANSDPNPIAFWVAVDGGYIEVLLGRDEEVHFWEFCKRLKGKLSEQSAMDQINAELDAHDDFSELAGTTCDVEKLRGLLQNAGLLEALSCREIEVAALYLQKKPEKEIAKKLSISVHTIGNHRRNIGRKLGIPDAEDKCADEIRRRLREINSNGRNDP